MSQRDPRAGEGTVSADVVAEVDGKTLAIDTSVWIFQASQQRDVAEAIYDEHARVLLIFIYRIMNLLRYGVTPIFVLEGRTPDAKMGRLGQRSVAKGLGGVAAGNRRGGRHDALGRRVAELLELMGLPHVEAPGEAEAMCAALSAAGLADAAVTTDVDSLLFGARVVYRECRLTMDNCKNNALERVDAAEVARRCFGLTGQGAGCSQALQAVACLSGCDYSVEGGRGVGIKAAMDAVQQLTRGRQDDSHVLHELQRRLAEGPDPRIMALKACTGCKTCGHEKHGRGPCSECGPGPCRPKAPGSACGCAFHRSEPLRKFTRTVSKATSTPGFTVELAAALAAFRSETERAAAVARELGAREGSLSWSRRPDVGRIFQLMHPLLGNSSSEEGKMLWTYSEVRDKLRPVLMEWDMRQGPQPSVTAQSVVEFQPRRIKKVAEKDGGTWAYIIEFERLPSVNAADAELDRAQLGNAKHVKSRHVRQSIIHRLWPQLLELREEEEQAKLAKPVGKRGGRKAGATDTVTSLDGSGAKQTLTGSPSAVSRGAAGVSPTGRRRAAGPRRGAAAAGSSQSLGSSDVLMRFLHGGTGQAASGPPGAQAGTATAGERRQVRHGGTSLHGRRAGGAALPAVDEEEEEDVGMQSTQANMGVVGGLAGTGARSQPGRTAAAAGEGAGEAAGSAGLSAAARPVAVLKPLWGDDGDDDEMRGDGGMQGASYNPSVPDGGARHAVGHARRPPTGGAAARQEQPSGGGLSDAKDAFLEELLHGPQQHSTLRQSQRHAEGRARGPSAPVSGDLRPFREAPAGPGMGPSGSGQQRVERSARSPQDSGTESDGVELVDLTESPAGRHAPTRLGQQRPSRNGHAPEEPELGSASKPTTAGRRQGLAGTAAAAAHGSALLQQKHVGPGEEGGWDAPRVSAGAADGMPAAGSGSQRGSGNGAGPIARSLFPDQLPPAQDMDGDAEMRDASGDAAPGEESPGRERAGHAGCSSPAPGEASEGSPSKRRNTYLGAGSGAEADVGAPARHAASRSVAVSGGGASQHVQRALATQPSGAAAKSQNMAARPLAAARCHVDLTLDDSPGPQPRKPLAPPRLQGAGSTRAAAASQPGVADTGAAPGGGGAEDDDDDVIIL